jgi:hypothetical protein
MNKFILLSFIFSGLAIAGCSQHDLTPLKGPDGQEWVAISCTHGAKNCWKAAGDFCPGGYVAADEVQSTTHGFLFSSHMRDEMLIRCKAPEANAEPQQHASRPTPPA